MIAEACLVAGLYDKGLEEVYRGMSFASETGVQFEVPRLRLLQGELLLHASTRNFEIAQGCFRLAFQLADAQGARGWALKALTSLTRLIAERGERQQARDRLTAIYADFTEGFGTPDLQDAKALLDQLI